jgi:hypothetical protein
VLLVGCPGTSMQATGTVVLAYNNGLTAGPRFSVYDGDPWPSTSTCTPFSFSGSAGGAGGGASVIYNAAFATGSTAALIVPAGSNTLPVDQITGPPGVVLATGPNTPGTTVPPGNLAFTPTTPGNWPAVPSTLQAAIDALAGDKQSSLSPVPPALGGTGINMSGARANSLPVAQGDGTFSMNTQIGTQPNNLVQLNNNGILALQDQGPPTLVDLQEGQFATGFKTVTP